MAVRTREEIMSQLQTIVGEDTSDETLAFIQDVSDTIGSENNAQRINELQQELTRKDEEWRKKYRDAFFTGKPDESIEEDEPDNNKPKSFMDLFTTK